MREVTFDLREFQGDMAGYNTRLEAMLDGH
jgi:urea carboxylase